MCRLYLIAFVCVLLSCTGYKTTHYSTGGMFEKGRIVNGKKEGLWLSWHENGEKLGEYHYKNGELNGIGKQWFVNGKIQALSKYKDGKLIDTAKRYHSNGRLSEFAYYNNSGLQDGKFTIWHENGNIIQEGYYILGRKDSICQTYYDNGKIKSVPGIRTEKNLRRPNEGNSVYF
jgi:antitoxin component YwqK of YwqJK toxin-antitoxin module